MSSDCPPQLQLSIPPSTTTFKRSFEQFGVDLDSPVALDAGGSGNNNDRNKRARSATSFSDGSSDTLGSSPQSSSEASGSSSRSSGSGSRRLRALPNDRTGQTAAAARAGTALPITSHQPPRLPTLDIQDIEMPDYPLVNDNDSDSFSSSNLPSPPLSQSDDIYRLSLQRFNEFDSEISVLRQRSPALARSPTLPPTLPPLSIFEAIPSQTTIEYLPDSPVSVGSATIFPRHALPDSEAASEFSLDFSGSSFATSQQHSPIDIATSQQHSPIDESSSQVELPASSASNDLGFTFRERLDSALGSLRSASPLVPGLDEEEEQNSSQSSSFTRPTLPNPPTLPPIITDTENDNVMWNDEPLVTPGWNMPPSLPSLEDLRDHALPSPSLRGLHHWLNMDEPPRRQDAPGTSSSPSDNDPGPSNRYRDRVRDIPTQSGGFTDTSARRGGPSGRRSPASAAAVRMLDQVMWNSSYSSSLFSGRSRSPPPSNERHSQFLSYHPSFGRPPAHFPLQGADGNAMNLDAWLAAAESAGPSDTTTGSSPPVHHSWTHSDDRQASHMLSQRRSRPAHLGPSNSLVSENASEARRRFERAELLEQSTTFASSSQGSLMEEGTRSYLPAWDAEWVQANSAPESGQSQVQPPDRAQSGFQAQRAARQSESQHPRPSSSRSFEEMFEAFLGPENDEFRQRTRPQRQQQQQHPDPTSASSSFGRERVLQREYPRARAPSPRPGPPPPPQQATHRRISSWSNSVSAPGGSSSAHQVPANDTPAHSRGGAWSFDSQSSSERDTLTNIYGSDYRGSNAAAAREEQSRPYLPIPSLPSPDLGGIFDRAPPSAPPGRSQDLHIPAALQHSQRARLEDERMRGSYDNLIAQLNSPGRARRLRNSLGSIRGVTSVFDLSDDEEDEVVEPMEQHRFTRFGRSTNEREAMGARARSGGVEAGSGSLYNRHGRFSSLAVSLRVPPPLTSSADYVEQISQSGVGAGNENSSSSGSHVEPFGEAPGTSRRSTYLNVSSAHRPQTPPLDTSRYPAQNLVGSGGNFVSRPSEPPQVPASNIQQLDPSSFAPGPFRNTLQSLALDRHRQVMERNNRAARHAYAPAAPARSSQPLLPSHAPSIPPLAFEEDSSDFQTRAPLRSDARYAYPHRPPPPPQSYADYSRPALPSRTDQFQQRRPPVAPGTSSSAVQNSDLHRYLSRQARMEASRIDDSDGSHRPPPIPSRGDVQGLNRAIEVLQPDGLSYARSRQLIEQYHRERGEPPSRNHPLPPLPPQSLSQSDQSLLRPYSSSRPRLPAEAIIRAISDDFDMADEDPLPARTTRNAGFSAESEHDRNSRDMLAFRGRRARAFRQPILARMGGRPRALGDFVADEEFDTSYEGLLRLAAAVGEAKPRSTPSHVISSMETAEYKDWATADSDKRCPICLDDYNPTDPVLKLTNCSHWLHRDCLQQWLGGASTCPVCRKPVHGPSSPRQSGMQPAIQDMQNYWPFGSTWRRGPPPPGPGPGGNGNASSGRAGFPGAWPRR